MKKARGKSARKVDDLRPEYEFDYSQAKPNRFAARTGKNRATVTLDPDVAAVFTTPEAVNAILRAIIASLPEGTTSKA